MMTAGNDDDLGVNERVALHMIVYLRPRRTSLI